MSVYSDNLATETQINTAIAKIVASYPQTFGLLNVETLRDFGRELADAIKKSNFSGQQLDDAVTYCKINKPTFAISDLCGFDQNVRLYSYSWACDKSGFVRSDLKNTTRNPWEFWWCRAQDLEKVNRIAKIQNGN